MVGQWSPAALRRPLTAAAYEAMEGPGMWGR